MQLSDIKKQEEQLLFNKKYILNSNKEYFNKYISKSNQYLFYILNGSDKWGAQDEIREIQKVIPDAEWIILSTGWNGFYLDDINLISEVKIIRDEPSIDYTVNKLFCYKSPFLEGYEIEKYDKAILCVREKDVEPLKKLFYIKNKDDYGVRYKKFMKKTEKIEPFEEYDTLNMQIYERAGYYTADEDTFKLTIEDIANNIIKL